MFYGIGGVRLIISFVHNEEDSYKAVGENIRINYNSSKQFRYTFWQHDYNCKKWFSDTGIDLLYISFSVFIADRICKRDDGADNWSRNIELHIPVLDYDNWHDNISLLEQTLNFLSGDHWRIVFRKREKSSIEKQAEKRWQKDRKEKDSQNISAVSMLSGGMDSLIGTIDLLESGKKDILFISHYGGGKGTKEFQDKVIRSIKEHYSISSDHFLQFHAAVVDGVEDTTRTRSFMFFAHAIVLATAYKTCEEMIISENGYISLNIPLTFSRIGTSSTRTTHPYYMSLLRTLIKNIGIQLNIHNPYQFKTKGEMLIECKNQKVLKENIANTMSCSHPDVGRHRGEKEAMHCGYCLPCTVRRAALKRANITDTSRYYDAGYKKGNEAKMCFNSYLQGLEMYDPQIAFMSIQMNGPIKDHVSDYADLYKRGVDEIAKYLEDI